MADHDAPKDPQDVYLARWDVERAKRRESRKARQRRNCKFFWGWVAAMSFTFALFVCFFLALRFGGPGVVSYADHGSIGDAVGPFATIFSTLTLFMALHGMTLQREELALQREESEDNRAEQEGRRLAMEDQVRALAASAETQRLATAVELTKVMVSTFEDAERYVRDAWVAHDKLRWMVEAPNVNLPPSTMVQEIRAILLPAPMTAGQEALRSAGTIVDEHLRGLRLQIQKLWESGHASRGKIEILEKANECQHHLSALHGVILHEKDGITTEMANLRSELLSPGD